MSPSIIALSTFTNVALASTSLLTSSLTSSSVTLASSLAMFNPLYFINVILGYTYTTAV